MAFFPFPKLLQRIANERPLRIIDHQGRPYLRRYYLFTVFGCRFYLHHFVDSDPAGLHSHPWKKGVSIILSGMYLEQTRFGCELQKWINFVPGDKFHRVILDHDREIIAETFSDLPVKTVWSIFIHSRLEATWGTLKDKGVFTQYVEERGTHSRTDGHSDWYKTAKKGKELLAELGRN